MHSLPSAAPTYPSLQALHVVADAHVTQFATHSAKQSNYNICEICLHVFCRTLHISFTNDVIKNEMANYSDTYYKFAISLRAY